MLGKAVHQEEVEEWLGRVGEGTLGARMGLLGGGGFAQVRPSQACRPGPLEQWAAKVVLANRLLEEEARRRCLSPAEMWKVAGGPVASPSEAEVADYYSRNLGRYHRPERRRVLHVLCASEDEAAAVVERSGSGEDLAVIARGCSLDRGSRGSGGRAPEPAGDPRIATPTLTEQRVFFDGFRRWPYLAATRIV